MTNHRWTWIMGAWFYEAIGAPFAPHLIIFNADHSLVSSNPDRGEANNSASSGIGVWEHDSSDRRPGGGAVIVGRFIEVNADPISHRHTSNLVVDFRVLLDPSSNNRFEGPAQSALYEPNGALIEHFPEVTLKGQRITLSSAPPVNSLTVS